MLFMNIDLNASVEGNMINSLDGVNPTQLLLRAIEHTEILPNRTAPTFREEEQFALAILTPAGDVSLEKIIPLLNPILHLW
jgi:hypothetical protein